MKKYDKLFVNGLIYTVDDNHRWAEALAISDDKIAFIGSDAEAEKIKSDSTEIIDLQRKMVLPGFIDGHMHVYMAGPEQLFKIVLHDLDTEEAYLKRIKDYVDAHPEMDKYEGAGWMNPAFGPKGPTRQALDSVCPDKPIVLDSGDHHTFWANTKAIEYCGITAETTVPEGNVIEREEDGYPSGAFREFMAIKLLDKARIKLGKEEFKQVIEYMQKFYAPYGVTMLFDAMIPPAHPVVDAYIEMAKSGKLMMKLRGGIESSEYKPSDQVDEFVTCRTKASECGDMFKLDIVKVFMDGVIEGKTGYLKEPYEDDPNYRGNPIWQYKPLKEMCTKADKENFDLHFHVIGDAACEMMVDCIEDVAKANPGREGRRPVATHLQVVDPEDIKRMACNGFVCMTDPYWFFKEKGYFDGLEKPYLGERAEHEYPMKDLIDAGMVIGAASDYSVTPEPNPLKGMQIAVTRLKETVDSESAAAETVLAPDQRVSLEQMVEAFTRGNAFSMGVEDITGTLEVGKYADMVILENNIFEVPIDKLHEVKVCMTVSNGRVIYEGK